MNAKPLKDFLESNKTRLTLKPLHPYNPDLNLIDELWSWVKNSVIHNVFFKDVNEIKQAVRGFINWANTVPN